MGVNRIGKVRSSELHRGLWAWFGAVGHHKLASSRGPSPSTSRSAVRRRARAPSPCRVCSSATSRFVFAAQGSPLRIHGLRSSTETSRNPAASCLQVLCGREGQEGEGRGRRQFTGMNAQDQPLTSAILLAIRFAADPRGAVRRAAAGRRGGRRHLAQPGLRGRHRHQRPNRRRPHRAHRRRCVPRQRGVGAARVTGREDHRDCRSRHAALRRGRCSCRRSGVRGGLDAAASSASRVGLREPGRAAGQRRYMKSSMHGAYAYP